MVKYDTYHLSLSKTLTIEKLSLLTFEFLNIHYIHSLFIPPLPLHFFLSGALKLSLINKCYNTLQNSIK
ncbi:hypothetical protein HanHA89_Chr08g0287531 [Helianthus annuus]|nr:hypothetical protein HanHA89_Chr08g0287531 [Helianthus annuus]